MRQGKRLRHRWLAPVAFVLCALCPVAVLVVKMRDHPRHAVAAETAAQSAPSIGAENAAPLVAASAVPKRPLDDGPLHTPGVRGAAEFYMEAFALYARLTDEEKRILSKPNEEVDADVAARLYEKIQPIMALIHRAAEEETCDWGTGPLSYDSPMPHLTKVMDLGKLALWSAAYRFPQEPEAAAADLVARAHIGHHVTDTMLGLLINAALDAGAINLVRENAARIDDLAMPSVMALMTTNFVSEDSGRAFEGEAKFAIESFQRFAAATPEERQKMLEAMTGWAGQADAVAAVERVLTDPTKLAAEAKWMAAVEQQMGEAMLWPQERYVAWWRGIEDEMEARPLAKLSLPALSGVYNRVQESRIRREMLAAAFAVMRDGPVALERFVDPTMGTGFEHIATEGGFELKSAFQVRKKPVVMRFSAAVP